MLRVITLVFILLLNKLHPLLAQEMPINGPDITQCGGFLVDDGFSSSSYSNNQNQTITICAQAPETILNLYFTVCALGTGDFLRIYDGNNTSAPLIGTYYGTDLQTTDITSTNASGCLTVQFISDNSVVGNFAAEISCGLPCVRPFAVVNTAEDPYPVLACPGETITFNGGQSQFAPGASMQSFEWNFDDGSAVNTTNWPSVSHTFTTPGAYEVQLKLTDNNNCTNNNLTDYVILVSTYPDFSLMSPNFELCQGGIEYLGVNYFIPDSIYGNDSLSNWIDVPYLPIPDVDFGGALFIPDDQSACFSSELTFTGFDNGAVIDDINDLDYFFINFEHSFMGDLSITFICPNGQSIAVHQQGGGGTYLGEPVDDESGVAGVGYDYYWSPTASNGTWADNGSGTLPSGTYESVQPWNVLLGCPLNGTWTVEVCDMWGADDGYIFDWSMSFNPDLYGELWAFTPIYGADCDSSYWTGPFIISQDDNCDFIGVEINTTGSYDYTYTVMNNFGCTFDTTITVNVFVASPVTAGPDMIFSCDPIQLEGGIDLNATPDCDNAAGTYQQCFSNNQNWVMTICPDVVGDGVTAISVDFISGQLGTGDIFNVYNGTTTGSPLLAGPLTGNLANQFFTATNAEGCLTLFVQMDGTGSCNTGEYPPFVYEVVCGDSDIPYTWQWTPSANLNNSTIASPTVNTINGPTEFILTGYPQGYPGCASSDTVMVLVDNNLPNPGEDAVISMCPGAPAIDMTEQLGGLPTPGGTWYSPTNIAVGSDFDPSIHPMGIYEYVVVQDGCVFSSYLDITIADPLIFVSNDTLICIGGTANLEAWTDPFNQGIVDFYWTDGTPGNQWSTTPTEATTIGVYASDQNTCVSDTAYVTVSIRPGISIIMEQDTTVCHHSITQSEINFLSGGLGPYSYQWTANDVPFSQEQSAPYLLGVDTVQFCVTVTDACETPSAQNCMMVNVPPILDIEVTPLSQGDCSPFNPEVEITTPQSFYNSAEWHFSNGTTSADLHAAGAIFVDPGLYHLELTLRDPNGCLYTETFNNLIEVYPDPIAAWNAYPFATDVENTTVQFENLSQGNGLTYLWDFGTDLFDTHSNQANPEYTYPTDYGNEYTVTLRVVDSNGCRAESTGIIDINDIFNVWIPNSFTPNNDLLNDVIFVSGSDISKNDFEWIIFNRWGDIVFRTSDINEPWTGNVDNGEHYAPNGVYNYLVRLRADTHVEEKVVKGYIILTR